MPQNTPGPSRSRKAGRGFLRMLRGLFGDKTLARAAESLDVLRDEYAAGRAEGERGDAPPRAIPHREKGSGAPPEPPPT